MFGKLNVTYVDFAPNCLDKDIVPMLETQKHTLRFMEGNITEPIKDNAAYGYCVDVIEHLTPDDIDKALDNCLKACQHVFFACLLKFINMNGGLKNLTLEIVLYIGLIIQAIIAKCTQQHGLMELTL